jgi:hypothetical protein
MDVCTGACTTQQLAYRSEKQTHPPFSLPLDLRAKYGLQLDSLVHITTWNYQNNPQQFATRRLELDRGHAIDRYDKEDCIRGRLGIFLLPQHPSRPLLDKRSEQDWD